MKFNDQTVNYIIENFGDKPTYIDESLKDKSAYSLLKESMKKSDKESATVLIGENLQDWNNDIVITDQTFRHPLGYDYKVINKNLNVTCYHIRDIKHKKLTTNNYKLNETNLFTVENRQVRDIAPEPFTVLNGKYKDYRALIVGSGPGWREINYDCLADNIIVFVVNYNFYIKADYQIFTDLDIANDLLFVRFRDDRKLIGLKERLKGQSHFYFSPYENVKECLHTGAYALQIVSQMGFQKIFLAGYNYKKYPNGQDYCYDKRKTQNTYKESGNRVDMFLKDFDKFKVRDVYNLSTDSKLGKYPYAQKGELYSK